ncbi:MAG TPA: hypothetical protein VMR86_02530 [Myxococcota bacterium]|nr:hypothetical protein [Myxococcota bacterium]
MRRDLLAASVLLSAALAWLALTVRADDLSPSTPGVTVQTEQPAAR